MSKSITSGSKSIPLTPMNGESFGAGGTIKIEIDETLGYIQKEPYLVVDLTNTSGDLSRWTLPNGVGASALIKTITIYSKRTGQTLETLRNYNQWCSIENQYSTDDISVQQRVEGWGKVKEAFTNISPTFLNPNDVENNLISPVSTTLAPMYTPRQLIIPLKTGLLGHWNDEEKAVPILNFGGVRIEIVLAPIGEVCVQMQPFGVVPTELYEPATQPISRLVEVHLEDSATNSALFFTDPTMSYFHSIYDLSLAAGMEVVLTGYDSSTPTPTQFTITKTISEVIQTATAGQLSITFTEPTAITTPPLTNLIMKLKENPSLNYEVSNVRLHVNQLFLTPEAMNKLGKPMQYEFMSYDLFLDSIAPSELKHQIQLASVATKGKALFSHYVNSTTENSSVVMNYYKGLRPHESYLSSVVYFINNQLQPNTAYDPNINRDKVISFNETQKALSAVNIPVKSLGSNEGTSLNHYSNTYITSRELARGEFIFPLVNAEPELRLEFSSSRSFNTRCYSYVFSKKLISISPQGIQLQL